MEFRLGEILREQGRERRPDMGAAGDGLSRARDDGRDKLLGALAVELLVDEQGRALIAGAQAFHRLPGKLAVGRGLPLRPDVPAQAGLELVRASQGAGDAVAEA